MEGELVDVVKDGREGALINRREVAEGVWDNRRQPVEEVVEDRVEEDVCREGTALRKAPSSGRGGAEGCAPSSISMSMAATVVGGDEQSELR